MTTHGIAMKFPAAVTTPVISPYYIRLSENPGVIVIVSHIDIVLVTYNSRRFLPEFFTTLKNSTELPFHLIVIDNASTDQTRSYLNRLRAHTPATESIRRMKLICNSTNLGVARAWNLGINSGDGAYVVFVNPDLKFSIGWLEKMVHCAENHPQAGVIGAKIVHFNNTIDHAGFLGGTVRGRGESGDTERYNQEVEVEGIHGCCFLVKRQILQAVGHFDERFFLYAEEDDYCIRVRQAGFAVFYSPAKIYHFSAGSVIPLSKRRKLHSISLQKFYNKWGM